MHKISNLTTYAMKVHWIIIVIDRNACLNNNINKLSIKQNSCNSNDKNFWNFYITIGKLSSSSQIYINPSRPVPGLSLH